MEFNEEILEALLKEISNLTDSFESKITDEFNNSAVSDSNSFYILLDKETKNLEKQCNSKVQEFFKSLLIASTLPQVRQIFSNLKNSFSFYMKKALSNYKNVFSSYFSKFRERLSEEDLRESLFKDIINVHGNVKKLMLGKEDIVISVGKRSYHLSNYLRVIAEQEVRKNFVYTQLYQAKKTNAIGIKISNHNTKTPLCKFYEGKTYYFKNKGLDKLKDGLPPFHINCKHFIIPIYEYD